MERPAEMVHRDPREYLMENKVARTYLRRTDFEQWGLSEGFPGYRHLKTGQGRQQAHSEACRKRIEDLLRAVSSVIPSQSQKKISMDTEQDPIPPTSRTEHQRQAHDPASPQALT